VTERLRVGVIGCGLIAQVMHLPYLRELPDLFEVVALCDVSPGTLAAVADAYAVPGRYLGWAELLEQPLDAVMVLTGGSHAPPAIEASRRGMHVFVEKPMCFTLREADAMIAAAASSGTTLFVGNMKRYDPAFDKTREEVARISDMRFVRVTTLEAPLQAYVAHYPLLRSDDLPADVVKRGREERERLVTEALGPDAGADERSGYVDLLLDSAVHELNLIRGFLGEPQAVANAILFDEGRSLQATLEYPEGLKVAISLVWLPDLRHYHQEVAFFGGDRRVSLEFPSPFLRSEPSRVVVEEAVGDTTWRREGVVSYEEAFKRELVDFHACATGTSTPRTPGASARRDIELCIAIATSSRLGRSVPIGGAATTVEGG
jgi:predicted dehydrogenase